MHLFNTRRRKVLATFATCLVAGLGAVALAAWLQDSEGPGKAHVGQLQQLTVSAGTPVSDILPGQTGDAAFAITNPNTVPVNITAIGVPTVDGGTTGATGCDYTNLSVNAQTGLSVTVPADTTDAQVVVPKGFKLAADAPSACANANLMRNARLSFDLTTTP